MQQLKTEGNFWLIIVANSLCLLLNCCCVQQVDVIVNSAAPDLNLTKGTVSAKILAAAGPGIQTECASKYPKGIEGHHIAETAGGQLPCKLIYHCACPEWDKGAGYSEKVGVKWCVNCPYILVLYVLYMLYMQYYSCIFIFNTYASLNINAV